MNNEPQKKQWKLVTIATLAGAAALLLYMPLNAPCLLNFDRSAKPVQLAEPDESIFGMVACDVFLSSSAQSLVVSLLPLLLGVVGAVAGRAGKGRAVFGGLAASFAVLLSFVAGTLIYPWLEAYWMSARELWVAVPLAFAFGAAGGRLSKKRA